MTSQIFPQITWKTGIRHEALRLLYYLKRLPEQELQNRGFLILPTAPHKNNHVAIVLPDLNYTHLWKLTSRLIPTTPMTAPKTLINQVVDMLSPTYRPPKTHFLNIPNSFFSTLFSFLPEYQSIITNIHLVVTYCGTVSQFNLVDDRQNILTIYLRPDAKINDILRVIVLSLIRHQLQYQENRSWGEIESIADFILHHSLIKAYLDEAHPPIMTALQRKQTTRLNRQSQLFQAKLGISTQNNWRISDDQIFYQQTKVDRLTSRQTKLMQLLIKNHGQAVSNDQIADTLWPNGENYSLWAIVKEIARIRQCIVNSGLPGSIIQSHRKTGYSLT